MKKILVVLLMVVLSFTMLFVFVGCSNDKETEVPEITGITAKVSSDANYKVGSAFDSKYITVTASLNDKTVTLNGRFEINIWYAYDNNSKTDVARSVAEYTGTIRVREVISESLDDNNDVIARVLQQPTCVNAKIVDEGIDVEVIFEILAEVIGETKMMVTVFNYANTYETIDDDFEGDINEDFINDSEE